MSKNITTFIFILIVSGCIKGLPDNCEGEYSFKRPYFVSHPTGKMKYGDTLILKMSLPLEAFNLRSDSIVNIDRFNKVLCGFIIQELLPDTTNPIGLMSTGAIHQFDYFSQSGTVDLTQGMSGGNRVRYYLNKTDTAFNFEVRLIPKKRGFFQINLLNGIIEDAFCIANIGAYLGNYSTDQLILNCLEILSNYNIYRNESHFSQSKNSYTLYCFIVE
jgi:hypothetical protein